MNALIELLAVQATTYIEPTSNSGEGWIFDQEKFAELIVKECSHQVMSTVLLEGDFDSVAEILIHASFQLKQHFGVEL